MARGERVVSVFGGPADRLAFGETDDFAAKVIPRKVVSELMREKHDLYQAVRSLREALSSGHTLRDQEASRRLEAFYSVAERDFPHDWLIRLEILEIARSLPSESWLPRLELELQNLSDADRLVADRIQEGIRVFGQTF